MKDKPLEVDINTSIDFIKDHIFIKEFHESIRKLLENSRYPYSKNIDSNYKLKDMIILLDGYDYLEDSSDRMFLTTYAYCLYKDFKHEVDAYISETYQLSSIKLSEEDHNFLLQYYEQIDDIMETESERYHIIDLLKKNTSMTPQDIRLIHNGTKEVKSDWYNRPDKEKVEKIIERMNQSLTPVNDIFNNLLNLSITEPVQSNKNERSL